MRSTIRTAIALGSIAVSKRGWATAVCLGAGAIPTKVGTVTAIVVLQALPAPNLRGRATGTRSAVTAPGWWSRPSLQASWWQRSVPAQLASTPASSPHRACWPWCSYPERVRP